MKKTNEEFVKELRKKNPTIVPLEEYVKSDIKISFQCKICGNQWKTKPNTIIMGHGCPKCALKRRTLKSRISEDEVIRRLKEVNPNIVFLENYKGMNIPIRVKCRICNNEWDWTKPATLLNGHGCPFCINKAVAKGKNDFETWCKQNNKETLLQEWDYKKNKMLPSEITSGSSRNVFWVCSKCGYRWSTPLYNRSLNNFGCDSCSKRSGTSFPEQAILFYLKHVFCNVEHRYRKGMERMELDIYIPDRRIGIEYDGMAWHTDISREKKKYQLCRKNSVFLIRIKENKEEIKDNCDQLFITKYRHSNYSELTKTIKSLFAYLQITFDDIDVKRDAIKIQTEYRNKELEDSIANLFPELLKEWDYSKNGNLDPKMINSGSNLKVWWICKNNHSYKSMICSRTRKGTGCRFCANKALLSGYNDLKTWCIENSREDILLDWDNDKNESLSPEMIIAKSGKKVFWKCHKCGYEWKISPGERLKSSCINCYRIRIANEAKKRRIPKKTRNYSKKTPAEKKQPQVLISLLSEYPQIVEEWDYEKNKGLTPDIVSAYSQKKVWWKCKSYGHSYEAIIGNRTKNGSSCPYCSNQKALSGFNDLATKNPKLCLEWDYNKNDGVSPQHILARSGIKYWWKCSICGNEWLASPHNRDRGDGCPRCDRVSRQKKVKNIDTGEIFNSIKEASDYYNCSGSIISNCCAGRAKSAAGYKWIYI